MTRKFNFPTKTAPTGDIKIDIVMAHDHTINHRDDILRSEICGCFKCLAIFKSDDIKEWTDELTDGTSVTAICPKCGADSVFGSSSGYPIEEEFLRKMQEHWFVSSLLLG